MVAFPFFLASALVASAPGAVDLQGVPLSAACTLLLGRGLRVPFVLAPDVAGDKRPVSLALPVGRPVDKATALAALRAMGLDAKIISGVWMVSKMPDVLPAVAMPPDPEIERKRKAADTVETVYSPRFRDPGTLAQQIAAVLPELRVATQASNPSGNADVAGGEAPDFLVFAGSRDDRARAMALLAKLDTERDLVAIRATIYEVSTGSANRSAFDLVAGILRGVLSAGLPTGEGAATGAGFLRFNAGGIDAVASALASDSRFKLVSSPHLLARSGSEAVLTSGSQVPVVGSVTVPAAGQAPVQSVIYRDSGVTLRVRPVVHQQVIDLSVIQEISSFARTTTGVDISPTLNRRALTSAMTARPGEVFVLGGLTQEREAIAKRGPFKGFMTSKSADRERSEILMILQVDLGAGAAPARSEASTDAAPAPKVVL